MLDTQTVERIITDLKVAAIRLQDPYLMESIQRLEGHLKETRRVDTTHS